MTCASRARVRGRHGRPDDEKYLFDLNGYLVVEGVLAAEEIRLANEAVDRHLPLGRLRPSDESLDGGSDALRGEVGRGELNGLLEWDSPWCEPFRAMLAHPILVAYLNEMLGPGFRMDHDMFLLWIDKGAEGFELHRSSGPGFDPNQYYLVRDGKMHNGLTVVALQLTDVNPGDGGLVVVPGSHKANFRCPEELRAYLKHRENVRQVTCRAGDAVIFTEAVTHETLPWTSDRPRRTVLTHYTAGNMAYVPASDAPDWADERLRAVMQPPYHTRLNRPTL